MRKTPEQVRQDLEDNGVSVAAWCREHGIHRSVVFDLLRGKTKAKRGESHKAAVLLGIKPKPRNQIKKAA